MSFHNNCKKNQHFRKENRDLVGFLVNMDKNPPEENVTSFDSTEQRAAIKFCLRAGVTQTDTFKFMNPSDCRRKVSRALLFKWHQRFKDGRVNISDYQRSEMPKIKRGADTAKCAGPRTMSGSFRYGPAIFLRPSVRLTDAFSWT